MGMQSIDPLLQKKRGGQEIWMSASINSLVAGSCYLSDQHPFAF